MTDLVSLLCIALIPIDCKITNFSLHLFVYFHCNNHNIGELVSATSKEGMTMNVIFAGATPNNQLKVHMPVSFVFAYAHPIAQHYRKRRA